jgi:hypothetical protein
MFHNPFAFHLDRQASPSAEFMALFAGSSQQATVPPPPPPPQQQRQQHYVQPSPHNVRYYYYHQPPLPTQQRRRGVLKNTYGGSRTTNKRVRFDESRNIIYIIPADNKGVKMEKWFK